MFAEARDLIASKRASEPLHVVFHEHLHCSAVDRTRALNRHVDTTGNRHMRAEKSWMNQRINESASIRATADKSASRRRCGFSVSAFLRFVSLHYWLFKTAGRQSGFFKLPVPAYSKSLYTGVSTKPGPFMFSRTLKSSLSSRKWMSPWPSMLKSVPSASKSSV